MAKKTKRTVIGFKCEGCGKRHYTLYKPNNQENNEKLKIKKFCPEKSTHEWQIESKLS